MSAPAFTATALDLFARAGHISPHEIRAMLDGATSGGAAVERLVGAGRLSETEAADLLSAWTLVPRTAPGSLDEVEASILARVPAEIATELRAVPAGTEPDGSLRVAMADPADERAATELAFFTGSDIIREAATVSEIARALARYPRRPLPPALIVDEDEAPAPVPLVIDDAPTAPRRLPPALIVDEP